MSPVVTDASIPEVSIVLPQVSGAGHLRRLVEGLAASLDGYSCEFLVRGQAAQRALAEAADLLSADGYLVRTVGPADLASSDLTVLDALRSARGEVVVCVDRDLEFQLERVGDIVRAVRREGVEVVVGTRYAAANGRAARMSLSRGLKRRAASLLAAPFWRLRDPMADCFALARTVVERAPTLGRGGQPSLELIVMAGCSRVVEVPLAYAEAESYGGASDWGRPVRFLKQIKRLADYKFGGWSQLGQFCMVGVTGLTVDLIIYATLLGAGLALPVARALSIFVAMSWTFTLNRRLSFSSQRFGRSIPDQYARYFTSNALGASINWSLAVGLSTFTAFFATHVLLAAMIGVAVGALSNFVLARYWVFTRSGGSAPPERSP